MPVIRLKTVVFPEPLGPMSPTISPSSTRKAKSWTARRPPKSFVRPSVSRSARLLDRDRLHLLEAVPLHLVEVDHTAGHVALVVERDGHAQDALVVPGGADGVADRGPVGLPDLLDRLQDDVGSLVGEGAVGADRPVLGFEGLR